MIKKIQTLLGTEGEDLLNHQCKGVPRDTLHLPGPDFLDRVWVASDRPVGVLRSLAALFNHGRLAGTGYLCLLPVDQGVEHSAAASFAPNPVYFDPENIVKLAIEGGCNARGLHPRGPGRGGPEIRPQDPLHRQDQSQRDS